MSPRQPLSGNENPYKAPEPDGSNPSLQDETPGAGAERIRKRYLNDEFLLRMVGGLFFLPGAVAFLAAGWCVILVCLHAMGRFPDGVNAPNNRVYLIAGVIWHVLIGALVVGIGHGMWNLHNGLRVTIGMISILFLFCLPYAILIVMPIFLILFCGRSNYICSPEYQAIIQATPHIRFPMFLLYGMRALAILILIAVSFFLF